MGKPRQITPTDNGEQLQLFITSPEQKRYEELVQRFRRAGMDPVTLADISPEMMRVGNFDRTFAARFSAPPSADLPGSGSYAVCGLYDGEYQFVPP